MDLNKAIEKKRKAFKKFDAMSAEEQRKATERGENPHEAPAVREKRKAACLEKRKKEFDKLPKKQRDILTAIGWNPHNADKPINRSVSYYEAHGSYLMDKETTTEL